MQPSTVLRFFAKAFRALFRRGSSVLIDPLPFDVNPHEIITRYLLSKSHFSISSSRVKPRALEPSSRDNSTSVFRIMNLNEDQIWRLARAFVSNPTGRSLYARADIPALAVYELSLNIHPDEPPPRHANIVGWPPEKHARMSLAQQLTASATLVVTEGLSERD